MSTFKEVFQGGWIITGIHQGYEGRHRIDAKRRFPEADKPRFFSEWGSLSYLTKLARDYKSVERLTDFNCYKY